MNQELPIFSQASASRVESYPFHSHPGTELITMRRGECSVTAHGTEFLLTPGQLLVVAPEARHNHQAVAPETEAIFIVFIGNPRLFNPATRTIGIGEDYWSSHLFEDIIRLSETRMYDLCDGLVLSLLKHLKSLETRLLGNEGLHPGLKRAIGYIEQNYARPLEAVEIARTAGVSPSHLRALFSAHCGQSVNQYLQNFRMARSRELLRHRHLTVAEIGARCGYPDPCYFSRLFRKIHQCSPHEYQEVAETRSSERHLRF